MILFHVLPILMIHTAVSKVNDIESAIAER